MIVQSLRLQCGDRKARAAEREVFAHSRELRDGEVDIEVVTGSTQLIRAALLNDLPRVLQLIQLGAPLDLIDNSRRGFSALHHASYLGHDHVVKALLDGKYEGRGATVDPRCRIRATPLGWASALGCEAVVRLLLSRGARVELQDNSGRSALHDAVETDHSDIVALLCAAAGATAALALKMNDGNTPLALAISYGRAACEAVLRAHGATE